jgi:DeoR/GlpR family transcriptional regulator of sugar metabolism
VLVDHTKFARRALHRFVDLADVDRVVVDPGTPPGIVDDLAARGVAVAVAEPA